jgi:hypothetical protein
MTTVASVWTRAQFLDCDAIKEQRARRRALADAIWPLRHAHLEAVVLRTAQGVDVGLGGQLNGEMCLPVGVDAASTINPRMGEHGPNKCFFDNENALYVGWIGFISVYNLRRFSAIHAFWRPKTSFASSI